MNVRSINITNKYDIILSALIRADGMYLYARLNNEDAIFDHGQDPLYDIYEFTNREVKLEELIRTRKFRHMVGWHQLRMPPDFKNQVFFSQENKPDWKDFYAQYARKHDIKKTDIRLIGTSKDYLKTIDRI